MEKSAAHVKSSARLLPLFLLVCVGSVVGVAVADDSVHPGAFKAIGSGTCLTVSSLDVWGRSRRDLSHSECRGLCHGSCIGYSYAPCERTCTLHGDPTALSHLGEDWNVLNGGSRIAISSTQCGYACYVRMLDCPPGTLNSNGVAIPHDTLQFGTNAALECPAPFSGQLDVMCGVLGVSQLGGRCRRQCEPATFVYLTFRIEHGAIRNGDTYVAPCPAGASGAVQLLCLDSEVTMTGGGCGNSCPGGAVRSGSAFILHGFLEYGQSVVLSCPQGFTGSISIQCRDEGTTLTGGQCFPRCQPGQTQVTVGSGSAAANVTVTVPELRHGERTVAQCAPVDLFEGSIEVLCSNGALVAAQASGSATMACNQHCRSGHIGSGIKRTTHPFVFHGTQVTVPCEQGFTGGFEVSCTNGQLAVLSGACFMTCAPGTVTSNLVTLPHGSIEHNKTAFLPCPQNYTGTLGVRCDDGSPVVAGFCGEQCAPSFATSQGVAVRYGMIQHGSTMPVECPAPYVGTLELSCYDRNVRTLQGICAFPCDGGEFSVSDARIIWTTMSHGTVVNATCTPQFPGVSFSGHLTLRCDNGGVQRVGGQCAADCAPFFITSQGSQVDYPFMEAFTQVNAPCSPSAFYGTLTLECRGGFPEVVSGTCGRPCDAEDFFGDVTRDRPVFIDTVAHERDVVVTCPDPLTGQFRLSCSNGLYTLEEGECGEPCDARQLVMFGANVESPAMPHLAAQNYSCNEGYSGEVSTRCLFGQLHVNSTCSMDCANGTAVIDESRALEVDHPSIFAREVMPVVPCPAGFAGGISLACSNGSVVVASGGCASNCGAGWFRQEGVEVPHFEIGHLEQATQVCPQPYFGSVVLRCNDGAVELVSGNCYNNCPAGDFAVRSGVMQAHAFIGHGTSRPDFQCPENFAGTFTLSCWDGVINVTSGRCDAYCQPGVFEGSTHGLIPHNEEVLLSCPSVGEIWVLCLDGNVQKVGGYCFQDCAAGSVAHHLDSTILIQHGRIVHNRTSSGDCTGLAVGSVTVYCDDGAVSTQPLPGERCYRGCPAGEHLAEDGTAVTTMLLQHGSFESVQCPGEELGVLNVSCYDAVVTVTGRCGEENCAAGNILNEGAVLKYPVMNDGTDHSPSSCDGEGYLGEARIGCSSGEVSILEVSVLSSSWPTSGEYANDAPAQASEEDRIILCGCCFPADSPSAGGTRSRLETGVLVWVASIMGVVALFLALSVGFYYFMKNGVTTSTAIVPMPPEPVKPAWPAKPMV